jgi:hypothetical protein
MSVTGGGWSDSIFARGTKTGSHSAHHSAAYPALHEAQQVDFGVYSARHRADKFNGQLNGVLGGSQQPCVMRCRCVASGQHTPTTTRKQNWCMVCARVCVSVCVA